MDHLDCKSIQSVKLTNIGRTVSVSTYVYGVGMKCEYGTILTTVLCCVNDIQLND